MDLKVFRKLKSILRLLELQYFKVFKKIELCPMLNYVVLTKCRVINIIIGMSNKRYSDCIHIGINNTR